MNSRKYVITQTAIIFLGTALCSCAMVGIFALLGMFDTSVVLGAAAGTAIATLNFFFMALVAMMAADRAENQNVRGGQTLIQLSYSIRLIALLVILVICAKSEVFNLIALVIPLVFPRPILTIADIIKKKGGENT